MCGICGFVSRRDINLTQLKEMNDTMYHRGPDDSGEEIYEFSEGYRVGFAQRRLSILDLSALGHQPMHSPNGVYSVVFNGEIYNYKELKEELQGYPFHSNCDTEVILAAYQRWGVRCVEKFNGMFAIALFDRARDKVYLFRDRIGKKPLYYWIDGENLGFASELKPIMACPGFHKKIREEVLARYLYQQYINAPESIFVGVYKLEPGSALCFTAGKAQKWKWWDVAAVHSSKKKDPVKDYSQAKAELKELLQRAVSMRMVADVPLGTFLSGGYDSSLITAIAQECSKSPVKTFSIGFSEETFNEARYAKQIAAYLGTDHTEMYVDEGQMIDLVSSIPQFYDEPFADSSQIPSMLVAALAREKVTVALSGDGGDELFCGYNVYENVRRAQALDGLGDIVHRFCRLPLLKEIGLKAKLPFRVQLMANNRDNRTKTQFRAESYLQAARRMPLCNTQYPCRYETEEAYHEKNWQIRRMLLDMDTYLPGDILCKVDRATMKYSLEARCPILDKDVMEYSYQIPQVFKYRKGIKKFVLKDLAYDYIPYKLLDRPKMGFGVPLDKWIRGSLRGMVLDYSGQGYLKKQGIFDETYVSRMVQSYVKHGDRGAATGKNYSGMIWSFLIFQQWYQKYM